MANAAGAAEAAGRNQHAHADPFVLYGGPTLSPFTFLDHAWHLDLGARRWTRTDPAVVPSGRTCNAYAYDPRSERIVMSGGGPEIDDEI